MSAVVNVVGAPLSMLSPNTRVRVFHGQSIHFGGSGFGREGVIPRISHFLTTEFGEFLDEPGMFRRRYPFLPRRALLGGTIRNGVQVLEKWNTKIGQNKGRCRYQNMTTRDKTQGKGVTNQMLTQMERSDRAV